MQIKQNEGSREWDALWLKSSVRLNRCGCRNSANDSLTLLPPPRTGCFRYCAAWQHVLKNFIAKRLLSPGIYPLPSPPNNLRSWESYPWGLLTTTVVPVTKRCTGEPQFCPKRGWKASGEGISPAFHCTLCSSTRVSLSPALALSRKQRITRQVMRDNRSKPRDKSGAFSVLCHCLPSLWSPAAQCRAKSGLCKRGMCLMPSLPLPLRLFGCPFLPAQFTCPICLLRQHLPLLQEEACWENGKFYALLLILHNLHYHHHHQVEQEHKCWDVLAKQALKI